MAQNTFVESTQGWLPSLCPVCHFKVGHVKIPLSQQHFNFVFNTQQPKLLSTCEISDKNMIDFPVIAVGNTTFV